MKYYIIDAFTTQPFGGNPAGVVLLDGNAFPEESLMLQIAAELRYSETAFIRRHSPNEFTIRYFTPKAEVELCGHATIASFHLLHRKGLASGTCKCHTLAGTLNIEVDNRVMMQMASPRVLQTIDDPREVYQALGLPDYQPSLPVKVVTTGLPDIMIHIPDTQTLQLLHPDMDAVARYTEKTNTVSFHVFAFDNDGHTAHVRDFAPLYGVPEESATGTANAALTHYLQQVGCLGSTAECTFLQGEAMGRPSVIATQIRPDGSIYVGGSACILAEGELNPPIFSSLKKYIEEEIIPSYDHFDQAHQRDHVLMVIKQSMELAEKYNADRNLAYTIAAFHDTGICEGREHHHEVSARIVHEDLHLPYWFSPEQIDLIAEAVEDHRASSTRTPRSLYGRIVADADRFIDPETIVRRTIQYGLDHYPELSRKEQYQRMLTHLHEKYGRGGYLKLWFTDSPNAVRLEQLHQMIEDENAMRTLFNNIIPTTDTASLQDATTT